MERIRIIRKPIGPSSSVCIAVACQLKRSRQTSFRTSILLATSVLVATIFSTTSGGSTFVESFQPGSSPCLAGPCLTRLPNIIPSAQATTAERIGRKSRTELFDRRRQRDYSDDDDDYYDDEEEIDDSYYEDEPETPGIFSFLDDLGENRRGRQDSGMNIPSSFGRREGWRLPDAVSKALLAGVFVLGVGLGVTIDSQVNTNPKDLASRDAIDQAAPNPTLCAQMGASAMAFDQRVFVSFNPFNVYVSQADVKPACVLRDANVVPILRAKRLINDDEVRSWYVQAAALTWFSLFALDLVVLLCLSRILH
jgi:Protein of unknown function (DUF3172)